MTIWDIITAMANADPNGETVTLSPLENLIRVKKDRLGTAVTIGVAGNLVNALGIENKYVGGLLLIDREAFLRKQKELTPVKLEGTWPMSAEEREQLDKWRCVHCVLVPCGEHACQRDFLRPCHGYDRCLLKDGSGGLEKKERQP